MYGELTSQQIDVFESSSSMITIPGKSTKGTKIEEPVVYTYLSYDVHAVYLLYLLG